MVRRRKKYIQIHFPLVKPFMQTQQITCIPCNCNTTRLLCNINTSMVNLVLEKFLMIFSTQSVSRQYSIGNFCACGKLRFASKCHQVYGNHCKHLMHSEMFPLMCIKHVTNATRQLEGTWNYNINRLVSANSIQMKLLISKIRSVKKVAQAPAWI